MKEYTSIDKAINEIINLDKNIPQDEMQEKLLPIFYQFGIETVMTALFQWELKTGYITESKLNDNERLSFYDEKYGLTFRLQVNIARSKYKPVPLQGKNIPDLYSPITIENVGIPGKKHLRVFLFPLDGKERQFFVQATPFPLFNNHFVLINLEKVPQKIDSQTLKDLFNFVDIAPAYTTCSNSDLAWTGASILKHMHYQIFGDLNLPVLNANDLSELIWYKDYVKISALHYPCGVIKLRSTYRNNIMNIMDKIISKWKNMLQEKQSVNLIVIKTGRHKEIYEGYIFLRNSDYRTPKELHKFKTEGVGIIEMAGEAILPVPDGDDKEWKWNEIRKNGAKIIKGIIEGNNPIKDKTEIKDLINEVIR